MIIAVLVAFNVGWYAGGVTALWTTARVFGRPLRWRMALLWPAAYFEQQDYDGGA